MITTYLRRDTVKLCVRLFVTPWTVAHQAPLSMESSRQEYWSGLPFPSPGDLPNPGTEPGSLVLQVDSLPLGLPWKPMSSLMAQWVKNLPAMKKMCVQALSQEDALEKEIATHSSILAWRIPWTEEPVGLQSMGSQRVGHD